MSCRPRPSSGANVLRYGSSLVYFVDGLVSGWSDHVPQLHIRNWATIGAAAIDTFTLGSTMHDVVGAQGEPVDFTPKRYSSGSSAVYFDDDRVSGWTEGSVPLRTFTLPTLPFIDLDRLLSTLPRFLPDPPGRQIPPLRE